MTRKKTWKSPGPNEIAAYEQAEARRKERAPSPMRMKGEAIIYLTKLLQVIAILPPAPPRHLTERDLAAIKPRALLIIKRLKAFAAIRAEGRA